MAMLRRKETHADASGRLRSAVIEFDLPPRMISLTIKMRIKRRADRTHKSIITSLVMVAKKGASRVLFTFEFMPLSPNFGLSFVLAPSVPIWFAKETSPGTRTPFVSTLEHIERISPSLSAMVATMRII